MLLSIHSFANIAKVFLDLIFFFFIFVTISWLLPFIFYIHLRLKKINNYRYQDNWKSDNHRDSNTEKNPWTNLQIWYQKMNQIGKSDKFWYCRAERAIIKCAAIEKRPILLSHWVLQSFKYKFMLFIVLLFSFFYCFIKRTLTKN